LLEAADDRVVGSMRMNPNARAISGGDYAGDTGFNANPVSRLFDLGAPIDLSRVGKR